jgi:hypothetical protein
VVKRAKFSYFQPFYRHPSLSKVYVLYRGAFMYLAP